jgi:phosphatidylglycerol:prolipoprotein diacylglycerol transferase
MHPLIPWFDPPQIALPGQTGPHPYAIHAFGVLVMLGFMVGDWLAGWRARRAGLAADPIHRLVGWLVVGTIVGGHIGNELMYEPEKVIADPWILINVFDGLSSYGGFIACVPICWYFFRYEKLPFWPYADCLAYGLSFGWFLGRMGCFSAHDHPGSPTNFWLGVYGTCPGLGRDVACHDMGLYEALWSLGVFGLFNLMDRRAWVPGTYVALIGALYGPARLAMDFLRPVSTDTKYFGWTPAQYLSLALIFGCSYLLYYRTRSGDAPLALREAEDE